MTMTNVGTRPTLTKDQIEARVSSVAGVVVVQFVDDGSRETGRKILRGEIAI